MAHEATFIIDAFLLVTGHPASALGVTRWNGQGACLTRIYVLLPPGAMMTWPVMQLRFQPKRASEIALALGFG
jgi:hypothetical protein